MSNSTAMVRYLVLPQRPPITESFTEDELASLVTRDAMIGVTPISRLCGGWTRGARRWRATRL